MNTEAARESARQPDGKFGTQIKEEADVDLNEPAPPPFLVSVQPQYWRGDYAIDAGPEVVFDAAPLLVDLPEHERRAIFKALAENDYSHYDLDDLYLQAADRGLVQDGFGPFYVSATMTDADMLAWEVAAAGREMYDVDNIGYIVRPGDIDDEGSRAVYCMGPQSLALAIALHERKGYPVVVTFRHGPDPELPDDQPQSDYCTSVLEAHAQLPDGRLLTIQGPLQLPTSGSDFVDDTEYRREKYTDVEALRGLEGLCDTQPDEELAATYVDPILHGYEIE